jgi:putative nucleotidyltransferase with HDIG domain
MLLEWLRRILGRKKDAAPHTPTQAPVEARPEEAFDLRRIIEYRWDDRAGLSAEEVQQIAELREKTLTRFYQSAAAERGLPFPPLARRLIAFLSGGCDVNRLVALLQRDPLIAAQVLKAANSAAHAGLSEVHGIREAVMRLGAQETGQLALSIVMQALHDREVRALHHTFARPWRALWLHSMTVAQAAGWLAMHHPKGDVQRSFVGGMLHDIGKTFALRAASELTHAGEAPPTLGQADALLQALLDQVHVEIGMQVARKWRLPSYVQDICQYHHEHQIGDEEHDLHIVRVVSGIDEIRLNPYHRMGLGGQVMASADALQLTPFQLRALLMAIREAGQRIEQGVT